MCGATQYPNVQRPLGPSLESSQATSVDLPLANVPEISPVIHEFSIVVGGPVYDSCCGAGLCAWAWRMSFVGSSRWLATPTPVYVN